jgi:hypothetical protein
MMKIGLKNDLYPHSHFTKHLLVAFEKSLRKSDLNQETSSLLIRWLENYIDFSLQQIIHSSTTQVNQITAEIQAATQSWNWPTREGALLDENQTQVSQAVAHPVVTGGDWLNRHENGGFTKRWDWAGESAGALAPWNEVARRADRGIEHGKWIFGRALLETNRKHDEWRQKTQQGKDQISERAMNRPKPGVEEWGERSLSSRRPGRRSARENGRTRKSKVKASAAQYTRDTDAGHHRQERTFGRNGIFL